MAVVLSFKKGIFVVRCTYDERHIPTRAKFRFGDPLASGRKHWYTESLPVAARLRDYADETAKEILNRVLITRSPWTGGLPVPQDQKPLPHQVEAAMYLLEHSRAYLAADPGLGKTIVAMMVANALHARSLAAAAGRKPWLFLYVCPPFLKRTVESELLKWAVDAGMVSNLHLIGDSVVWRPSVRAELDRLLSLESHRKCLFLDEAHRFKNEESERGRAVFGGEDKDKTPVPGLLSRVDRAYFLSGTPMPNRPRELWPVVNHLAPEAVDFMSFFDFARRYCAARKGEHGWDFNGASNVDELFEKMRATFMLRQKKDEVFDLPEKLEELVILGDDMSPQLARMDAAVVKHHSPEDLMEGKLKALVKGELHLSTYRRLLGREKVPGVVELVHNLLQDTDESVLVFAHHLEVIDALALHLGKWKPHVMKGDTPMGARQEMTKRFQAGEGRLFILQDGAGGVGWTLTRASRVIIMEPDWVPGNNDQVGDRAHRIGQLSRVLVQYVVFSNSIDRKVMEANFRKRKTINKL